MIIALPCLLLLRTHPPFSPQSFYDWWILISFADSGCLLDTEGGGGGVTTHTHVSGEMVKPSMYNCLTLIKGGWGVCMGQESCLKAWRGGALGIWTTPGCARNARLVQATLHASSAAADNTRQMWHTHAEETETWILQLDAPLPLAVILWLQF